MQLFDLSYQIAITCLNAATNNSHYAALEMIYALTEVYVCANACECLFTLLDYSYYYLNFIFYE